MGESGEEGHETPRRARQQGLGTGALSAWMEVCVCVCGGGDGD